MKSCHWIMLAVLQAGVTISGCDSAPPPGSAASWHEQGREARALENYPRAEDALERAVQLEPGNYEYAEALIDVYVSQGKFAEAASALRGALAAGIDSPGVHFQLGETCLAMDDVQGAQQAFEAVLERDPANVRAHNNLASIYARGSDIGRAIEYLERARDLDPRYVGAHYNLGLALLDNGDVERGARSLEEAVGLDSLHLGASLRLGALYVDQGRSAEAIPLLRRAAQVDTTSAQAHYHLGLAFLGTGELSQAIHSLRLATRADPTFTDAYYRLGRLLLRQGRADEGRAALATFEKWSQVGHGEPRLWKQILHLKNLLAVDPLDPYAHVQLAVIYDRQGWAEPAMLEYRRALQANPAHLPAYHGLASLRLRGNDARGAAALYRQVVTYWPDDFAGWSNLCVAQMMTGEFAAADESCLRSVSLRPDLASPHANLASLYLKTERPELALASYRRALQLDPDNARIRQAMARLTGPPGTPMPARGETKAD